MFVTDIDLLNIISKQTCNKNFERDGKPLIHRRIHSASIHIEYSSLIILEHFIYAKVYIEE
jgi:hypothetical protein